ncbi:aldehyde dehydrogenase [Thermoactinomyces intermedius]|uniref:Aldehyde dehydrogenase n=1 Tax=Thermoactinomyces intermedius TaxID=2024 RepID=A0A8I1A3L4_THEIN|nr:aldehyde dehydrogenase [Thermoactinomyces intermedius]MBA4547881.1 aldehyde dehydrogenase [Thermoactinomyces intermedius]MBA4836508.1 aldehyde dehydrogenase [Thermoactinomyces intermedius]MBH8593888.1 aldehyde dehydrogenase [Thermoactinomyces intermedius]
MDLSGLVRRQKAFFYSGKTRELSFRLSNLQKLLDAVKRYEPDILTALKRDLNKSEYEAYVMEIMVIKEEIKWMKKNLRKWAKPRRVKTPLVLFGARSYVYPEPYGVNLIIGPWNYPVQLILCPLTGAIAAGNCAVIKPSEYTPHTSKVLKQMIEGIFDPEYVAVVEGEAETARALIREPFDHIFFTGSVPVGRSVMESAAKSLTPVTLELGGKSPVIVSPDCNVELTARRIVWGKFTNAGQTCVAPDYVYVPEELKEALLNQMKEEIKRFYGENPLENPDYTRIVSAKHFQRLQSFLAPDRIVVGGKSDPKSLKIEPTILDPVSWEDPVMQEEIFGPVLPVLTYCKLDEVIQTIRQKPKPLALYVFAENKNVQEKVIASLPFGGGCVNDTLMHVGTPHLPFGGVGPSGIGRYHGKYSFDCFSHQKGMIKQTTRFDMALRYPYVKSGLKWIRRLTR